MRDWIIGVGAGVLVAIVAWILGYLRGCVIKENEMLSKMPKKCGTVLVETSDPDGPYLFLDLSVPIDELGSQKEVIFTVDTNGVVRE